MHQSDIIVRKTQLIFRGGRCHAISCVRALAGLHVSPGTATPCATRCVRRSSSSDSLEPTMHPLHHDLWNPERRMSALGSSFKVCNLQNAGLSAKDQLRRLMEGRRGICDWRSRTLSGMRAKQMLQTPGPSAHVSAGRVAFALFCAVSTLATGYGQESFESLLHREYHLHQQARFAGSGSVT